MTVYKRGSVWWADFTVNGQRYRVPLKTSDRREAQRREKLRITEAQNSGGLLPRKTTGVTLAEAAEVYLSRRKVVASGATVALERASVKNLVNNLGTVIIGNINIDTLARYVATRKAEGMTNRTVNIEIGVLRRVLKMYRRWHVVGEDYHPLPEAKDIGRALTPEQELLLFSTAATRPQWSVAFWASLVAANTTAAGCELRNLRLQDIDTTGRVLNIRVGKNRFRVRPIPLNQTALWAVVQLIHRAKKLGATSPENYLIPRRIAGKQYDPTQPPSRWAWRRAWRQLTKKAGLEGLRSHDLRHHAITKMAESADASEQTIMSIAGHVSREMLEHYSHVRMQAKRRAVEALDNVTITSQLDKWKAEAQAREEGNKSRNIGEGLVGTVRFELTTPCTPSKDDHLNPNKSGDSEVQEG